VWDKPEGLTNSGKPSTLGEIGLDGLVYSFHNYADLLFDLTNPYDMDKKDPVGYRNQEWVIANSRRQTETLGAVPVLTDFSPGNDTEDLQNLLMLDDNYRLGLDILGLQELGHTDQWRGRDDDWPPRCGGHARPVVLTRNRRHPTRL